MQFKASRRMRIAGVGAVTAAAVLTTLAPVALAAEPAHRDGGEGGAAEGAAYNDQEVVGLLTLGSGRAAQEHPDVLDKFGIPHQNVGEAKTAAFTRALSEVDPRFHETVTENVQSGDPYKVDAALTRLAADVNKVTDKKSLPDGVARGSFWVKTDNVVLQTGTVATTVAAVAEVGVVVVVAYRTADDTSQFTREALNVAVAKAL
ncbi:hypothetical protein ABZ953_32840 [Streptomyces sp. NPDC046465]|uniref:hypothetical protein n=1 Tax=Streptomyces sp. NPDC046465 TaxID=3155810 RepID=UPI003401C6E9